MTLMAKLSEFQNRLGGHLALKERGFICAALAEFFALGYHICFLIFFYMNGIREMFYFNIFSVICFCFNIFVLYFLNKVSMVFFITVVEVLVHQILADYFLGGLAGFHFLIMLLVVFPFLVDRKGFNVGIPTAFICICIFFGCEFVFARTTPVYELSDSLLKTIRFVNIVASMTVLFTMTIIFKLIIDYIEKNMEELNKRNETLLENILPRKIMENLRDTGKADPELFEGATVLFTDIVNFTNISKTLPPDVLINELNDMFTNFDRIMEKHNCMRIKTIGDAYMAVCGLPEKNPDHTKNILEAALECRDYIEERNKTSPHRWTIRLGAHSGKVVAGIVGITKYIYDVFGDTVNVASRMESSSEEMKLSVSQSVFDLQKNNFSFSYRGEKEIKGKGNMALYFVEKK